MDFTMDDHIYYYLMELTSHINSGFRRRLQTDVVYTDFSKAFDKVNHDLLIAKLNAIGSLNGFVPI